jgi:hypothetical protein
MIAGRRGADATGPAAGRPAAGRGGQRSGLGRVRPPGPAQADPGRRRGVGRCEVIEAQESARTGGRKVLGVRHRPVPGQEGYHEPRGARDDAGGPEPPPARRSFLGQAGGLRRADRDGVGRSAASARDQSSQGREGSRLLGPHSHAQPPLAGDVGPDPAAGFPGEALAGLLAASPTAWAGGPEGLRCPGSRCGITAATRPARGAGPRGRPGRHPGRAR